jgi:hypothetical protein
MQFMISINYMFRHRSTVQWEYQYLHRCTELVFLCCSRVPVDDTQMPKHVGVNAAELYFAVFDWVHLLVDILNIRTCTVWVTSNLISYISISKSSLGMNMPSTTLLNCYCNLINISTLYGRDEINIVSRSRFTPTLSSCPWVLFIYLQNGATITL